MEKSGIAFDIGTTTIAGSLVDLTNCKEKKTALLPNPQMKWGRDVLSRIAATVDNQETLKSLQEAVVNACNEIIKNLIDPQDVKFVVATGNSVMEHLFLGIPPASLTKVPYKPAFKEAKKIRADAI
ncbi:MAG: hypothetical protein AAB257_00470, partial [Nitrospinota bacterium]